MGESLRRGRVCGGGEKGFIKGYLYMSRLSLCGGLMVHGKEGGKRVEGVMGEEGYGIAQEE